MLPHPLPRREDVLARLLIIGGCLTRWRRRWLRATESLVICRTWRYIGRWGAPGRCCRWRTSSRIRRHGRPLCAHSGRRKVRICLVWISAGSVRVCVRCLAWPWRRHRSSSPASARAVAHFPPVLIVLCSLLWVTQDLVGRLDCLELGHIFHLFAWVSVWVIQSGCVDR